MSVFGKCQGKAETNSVFSQGGSEYDLGSDGGERWGGGVCVGGQGVQLIETEIIRKS